ncbi:MAG: helix-turn-helix transcriptional regulator [Ruminococcus sp.]|nr:helix-turn-helix transcriptional regulator [Ruminococcus sp.]
MNIRSVGWNCVYDSDYSFFQHGERGVFLYLLSRSEICIDGRIFPENTLVIFDGSEDIVYSTVGDRLVCDWICFDAEGDSELADIADIAYNVPVLHTDWEFISGLIGNITTEFYSTNSRRMKIIDFMMKTLLIKAAENGLNREIMQSAVDPHYSTLIELRERIYRNPQMKWNVDTMAAVVNMSRSYFQHIYREIFGVSCMTDVINGKIEKAKEILSETGCTVSQVAAMCGYENDEHFMRQFKKIVGVTPTAYRKNK